jgi:predicted ester cyclase
MGLPATGRSVDVKAIDILSFADGRGTAHWGVFDAMAMMQQLGAIPGPG